MTFVDKLVFNLPKAARKTIWDTYLFKNAIHVDSAEFKTQHRTTFSAMNQPLGVKRTQDYSGYRPFFEKECLIVSPQT